MSISAKKVAVHSHKIGIFLYINVILWIYIHFSVHIWNDDATWLFSFLNFMMLYNHKFVLLLILKEYCNSSAYLFSFLNYMRGCGNFSNLWAMWGRRQTCPFSIPKPVRIRLFFFKWSNKYNWLLLPDRNNTSVLTCRSNGQK